jgi:hypothetical protein
VILTRNGIFEGFESTLKAISKQIGIAEIEVVVADSGSSDETVQALKDYGARCLVYLRKNSIMVQPATTLLTKQRWTFCSRFRMLFLALKTLSTRWHKALLADSSLLVLACGRFPNRMLTSMPAGKCGIITGLS